MTIDSFRFLTSFSQDAAAVVRELFHVCYWIARTYAKGTKPNPALQFDASKLEKTLTISASTVSQIQALKEKHDADAKALKDAGVVALWLAGKHEADGVDRHIFMGCDVVHELTLALAELGVK